MHKAISNQDAEAVQQLEKQFVSERKSIAVELEEKKELIRKKSK